MLDDRSYMRGPGFRTGLSVTVVLILANIAIFVVQQVLEFYRLFPVSRYFALSLDGLSRGWVWQLLTFQFLHDGVMHLLLNLFGLFFAGRALEHALGPRRMLTLYLISGTAGGILQVLLMLLFGPFFGTAVVGASAGVLGLIAAFATLHPDETIHLLLFFVVAVPMKARVLLWAITGLALLGVVVPRDNLADGAHLGGILAAVVWTRWVALGHGPAWQLPRIRFARGPKLKVMPAPNSATPGHREPDPELTDDYISREVDPILEKLHRHGVQSLTDKERRVLQAASQRMRKS